MKMKIMKFSILKLFIFYILNIFNSSAQTINCKIYENATRSIKLFDNNKFVMKAKSDRARLEGDDTLSFGYYEKKGESFFLYSDTSINSQILDVNMINENKQNNEDLTIVINSPYNDFLKRNPKYLKSYYYLVSFIIDTVKDKSSYLSYKESYYLTIFFNDTIVLKQYANKGISKLYVDIVPIDKSRNPWVSKLRVEYNLKDIENNFISLSLPQFTKNYIYYYRFNGSKIKKINHKLIQFNGSNYYLDFKDYPYN